MERDQERLLFWVIGMHFGREATEFSIGFALLLRITVL